MKNRYFLIVGLMVVASVPVLAATTAKTAVHVATHTAAPNATTSTSTSAPTATQRNVNQQQRIENGLKSGDLTTDEAARLEKGEARIDKAEKQAGSDGTISNSEAAQIDSLQDSQARRLNHLNNNTLTSDTNTAGATRLENDVQRNVNQEQRINSGVTDGTLTTSEAARLEGSQARSDSSLANAAASGNGVNAQEQTRIKQRDDYRSKRIYRQRHDGQTATGTAASGNVATTSSVTTPATTTTITGDTVTAPTIMNTDVSGAAANTNATIQNRMARSQQNTDAKVYNSIDRANAKAIRSATP